MYIESTQYIQSPDQQGANQIHLIGKFENILFCFLSRTLPDSDTSWTPATASVKQLVLLRGARRHDFEIYTVYLKISETDYQITTTDPRPVLLVTAGAQWSNIIILYKVIH